MVLAVERAALRASVSDQSMWDTTSATWVGTSTLHVAVDLLHRAIGLADEIERKVGVDPIDVELLVEQSEMAARGLRRLVEAVRSVPRDGEEP